VHLAGLRGTPMVVNVWAQWCGPCREEIPLFQRLHERSSGQLRVLGIDLQDPNMGMALAFAAETGMTYPQLQDLDGAVPDALRVRGIPLTVFVAADGRVAYTQQGVVDSARELRALVEEHLGVSTR
jgi:thiol-disulfide isomerase/thioredoxin